MSIEQGNDAMSMGAVGPHHAVVIALGRAQAKCGIGSMAHHPAYGVCEVVAAMGLVRTLEVIRYSPEQERAAEPQTLYDEIIESEWIDVHVAELQPCVGNDTVAQVASVVMLERA